jgi:hypothetical protein
MAGPKLYKTQEGIIKVEEAPGIRSALGLTLLSLNNREINHWKYNEHVLKKLAAVSGMPEQDYINIYNNFLEENQGKNTEELIKAFDRAMN